MSGVGFTHIFTNRLYYWPIESLIDLVLCSVCTFLSPYIADAHEIYNELSTLFFIFLIIFMPMNTFPVSICVIF